MSGDDQDGIDRDGIRMENGWHWCLKSDYGIVQMMISVLGITVVNPLMISIYLYVGDIWFSVMLFRFNIILWKQT